MKKILFSIFILALSTMIGCQKSEVAEDNLSKQVTVTANIAGSSTTRIALTPATDAEDHPIVKVAWKDSGESFKVWGDNSNNFSTFTQTATLDDAANVFSGTLPTSQPNKYLAVYPASVPMLFRINAGGDIHYNLDDDYIFTQQDGKLSEDKTLMIAEFNGDDFASLEFQHQSFLLMPTFKIAGVQITTDKIETITLKDMALGGSYSDCVVNCSSLNNPNDDIYIYIYDPSPNTREYRDHPEHNGGYYIREINLEVETSDGKTYEGTIHMPTDYALQKGNLYTATVSLTRVVSPNVITYTTFDNQPITFGQLDLSANLYSSHTFDNGIGRITLNDNVTSLPSYAITSKNVKTITLPSNITTLENVALGLNEYLTSIDITYITELRDNALSSNPSLSNITMPQNSYTIGVACFAACTALTQIDLSNATSIGNSAFVSCGSLTTIIIDKDTPPTLGTYTPFDGCPSLSNIYVPDSAIETYKTSWAIIPNIDTLVKPISTMQ